MIKKLVSLVLATAMVTCVGTTAIAKSSEATNGGEAISYSTFYSTDDITGEPIEHKIPHYADTPNYVLPSNASTFEGVEEAVVSPFQPFNYRSDWKQVTNVNANPYNGIVKLNTVYADGSSGNGTGFVVGNGYVLTSAHNLHDNKKGGTPKKVTLTFLKNGSSGTPHTIPSSSMFVNSDWYYGANGSDDVAYDYGIIKIGTSGKMSFGLYAGVNIGTNYTITGYPKVGSKYDGNKMYTDTTKLTTPTATLAGAIKHDSNIAIGVSGAPMYGSNNYAVGIQSVGWSKLVNTDSPDSDPVYRPGENQRGGFATPITQAVIDFVRATK